MIYYNLSQAQLENYAVDLLKKFDAELLVKPKPIDVYAVIEKCLNVPYDWKYLTPDQSILGMTAFNAGYIWAWEKPSYQPGDKPFQVPVEKGSILIDSTLTESPNRGRENFTVMHEVFHQVIHPKCFARCEGNYGHQTSSVAIQGKRKPLTAIDHIEHQANACAAAFLMPAELLTTTYRKCYSGSTLLDADSLQCQQIIKKLAPKFNASKQALKYRLITLKLIKE